MEKNLFIKKTTTFIIIILFIVASFIPSISGNVTELDKKQSVKSQKQVEDPEDVLVTCYNFGLPGEPSKEIEIPQHEAEYLYEKIKKLNFAVAADPLSEITQQLQIEIIDLADEYDLLPTGLSKDQVKEQYIHAYKSRTNGVGFMPQTQSKASEFLCTFVSSGSGGVLPIIALPRFIPIIMIPIPRLFMIWKAQDAVTSCGGLRSGTGFIAYGQQNGIALGFWGLGFTFSLPPLMGVYGLAGYSLYASVNADAIEFYPPNRPPVISSENPSSESWDVLVSLSELSFRLDDADGDLMSYTVTTDPDIGSDSGILKPNGVYTIPISDLDIENIYRWTVEATDGKATVEEQFSFITEGPQPFDPFNEGWEYRKQITIDHTQVADDLNNFPVLVSTTDSDLQDKAQNDGDDILFMDDTGVANKVYHEIEWFDDSSGGLSAWVGVEDVSSDEDTVFYMYYGNPSCSSQQFPERVWIFDYEAVYHLADKTSSTIEDSTSNDNDGVKKSANNPIEKNGKIGFAQEFSDDYIDLTGMTATAKSYTFSFWLNAERSRGDNRAFWFDIETGRLLFKWIDNYGNITLYDGDNRRFGPTPGADVWQQVVMVTDSSSHKSKLYINGSLYGDELGYSWQNIGGTIKLGSRFAIHDGIDWFYWNGIIDETRISNTARSSSWISTSYNNQNDPSSFIEVGPEEPAP